MHGPDDAGTRPDLATGDEVLDSLLIRFRANLDSYQSANYREAQLRQEFLDPLFASLGWDMENRLGYSEAYKEVIHEDAIKVGGATKAPDYCFRVGGERKFFVEAKKPSIPLHDDATSAYQLRRYAWSSKLALSVLTNFAEIAVYDGRIQPDQSDNAAVARLIYLTRAEYPEQWSQIRSIFGRAEVLAGSFDAFAEEARDHRGTVEVDAAFLREIETWRKGLARNIAQLNPALTQRELNFCVQQTIDRIVFLRICEDRGIEAYGTLAALVQESDVYSRLCEVFERADAIYNSGLFHFIDEDGRQEAPDHISLGLSIDDEPLRRILGKLYYPESPYEFSVLPVDILGHVYEQFLGGVIRLSANHEATIEEKPIVRKAGGVYYTPTRIVEYMVREAVGRAVADKTPAQVAKLTVVDPACGSGSFLLGAYKELLDWHLGYYVAAGPEKFPKQTYQVGRSDWRLTTSERKRILLNNIYGVDIDPQAAEVTKLSLVLKVLEGESDETIASQLKLFHERALPDLANNIKCGNSIIGTDYFLEQQLSLMDSDVRSGVNVFDWTTEFPNVFRRGGFDVVIGNPPYVDSEWMSRYLATWRQYCVGKYKAATGNWDLFCVFIEKAVQLCRRGGLASLIVPNKLGSAGYAAGARQVLAHDATLLTLRDYSSVPVFPVAVYPLVFLATNARPGRRARSVRYERMQQLYSGQAKVEQTADLGYEKYFGSDPAQPWSIFQDVAETNPSPRLRADFPRLDSVCEVWGGATVAEAYELAPLLSEWQDDDREALRVVNSGTIDPFVSLWGVKRLRYLGDAFLRPVVAASMQSELPPARIAQTKRAKVILAGMTKQLEAVADPDGTFLAAKSTTIVFGAYDPHFMAAILNSRLMGFYYRTVFGGNALQGGYLRIGPPQIRSLPFPQVDLAKAADRGLYEAVIASAKEAAKLATAIHSAATPHEANQRRRELAAVLKQLDTDVYQLYGLREAERGAVEAVLTEADRDLEDDLAVSLAAVAARRE